MKKKSTVQPKETGTPYANTAQVAELLGISPLTVRRWIKTGFFEAHGIQVRKIKRRWLINQTDLISAFF